MVLVAYNAHYSSKYLQTFTLHHISTNCSSINKGTIPEVLANTVFIFSTAPSFLGRSRALSAGWLRSGKVPLLRSLSLSCARPRARGAVGTPGVEQRAGSCPRLGARGSHTSPSALLSPSRKETGRLCAHPGSLPGARLSCLSNYTPAEACAWGSASCHRHAMGLDSEQPPPERRSLHRGCPHHTVGHAQNHRVMEYPGLEGTHEDQ